MKRALFLTKYGQKGASSRYRFYQYSPFLERAGIECMFQPLLPSSYLDWRYSQVTSKGRSVLRDLQIYLLVLRAIASRWLNLLNATERYDVICISYEALPYMPFLMERNLYTSGCPTIVDYDDAVHITYHLHPNPLMRRILARKVDEVVKRCTHVIVANRFLLQWASEFNSHVTLIPTSVDLRRYPYRLPNQGTSSFVVGWIGTPITARYLHIIEGPLRQVRSRWDFVFKVVGAPNFAIEGIEVHYSPWSEETEVADLQTLDVGVMPLVDGLWERGKSALKLIQYMAAGAVAVGSRVGTNEEVIKDGVNGLLAGTEDEWEEKLTMLFNSIQLRQELSINGRRTVEDLYSLQANAPKFLSVLREVLG